MLCVCWWYRKRKGVNLIVFHDFEIDEKCVYNMYLLEDRSKIKGKKRGLCEQGKNTTSIKTKEA